jgi:hypothetical protein
MKPEDICALLDFVSFVLALLALYWEFRLRRLKLEYYHWLGIIALVLALGSLILVAILPPTLCNPAYWPVLP